MTFDGKSEMRFARSLILSAPPMYFNVCTAGEGSNTAIALQPDSLVCQITVAHMVTMPATTKPLFHIRKTGNSHQYRRGWAEYAMGNKQSNLGHELRIAKLHARPLLDLSCEVRSLNDVLPTIMPAGPKDFERYQVNPLASMTPSTASDPLFPSLPQGDPAVRTIR